MNTKTTQRPIKEHWLLGTFYKTCVLTSLVLVTVPAQAVRFRLPLSSDTGVHYYYDHNTSSGVTAWNCSGSSYNGHGGSDFSGGPRGRAIFAAASGTLIYKIDGFGDGYAGSPAGGGAGNHVRIDHGGGVVTWYAHMTVGSVTGRPVGSGIACGEQVGGVGTSGSSTGLHLHLTVQVNGANRDPFIGGCGGLGWWVNQGSGSPSTACEGGGGGKPAEFDPYTAQWYLRNSNTTGGIDNQYEFGAVGDIPVMGDWDGNGSITPGVFRPSTARWYLRNSNSAGGVDYVLDFGLGSDIPIVGDWDGNGTFTPGVFRPSTAQWFLRNANSSGGVDYTFYYGVPGDRPVTGDWDGNRTFTPGVFRPSTAAWYLRNSNSNGPVDGWFYFGAANDSPVTGDWNGDGYWTAGVYRNGIRYLTNSNLNPTTDVIFTYGANHNWHLAWR